MVHSGAPTIDLSPTTDGTLRSKLLVARQIDQAFTTAGFLSVVGHGVPDALIAEMRAISLRFFARQEGDKRKVLSRPREGRFCGWVPLASDSAGVLRSDKAPPADLRERFRAVCSQVPEVIDHAGLNQWPARPPEMRWVWQRYYRAMEGLASRLLGLVALALELPENYLSTYFDRHFSVLVASHSPAQERPPQPGQLRCGEHSDFGTLTLVHQESDVGGLEILRDGEWRAIEPVPGAYVVNIGDLMARWTNDRWRSTVHRVAAGGAGEHARARRLSLIYFNQPNLDAEISCLPSCRGYETQGKYAPITLREHFSAQQRRLTEKQVEHATR